MLTGAYGGIVLTPSVEESYRFVNDYAPEHLEILSTDPFTHLGHITEAAEILTPDQRKKLDENFPSFGGGHHGFGHGWRRG